MLLTALQRFASSERRILLILCLTVISVDSYTWFAVANYYSEYEGIVSRLYELNFGSECQPRWFNMYSPVGYFMYEPLWGIFNSWNNEIAWYDLTMWFLYILSKMALVVGLWMGAQDRYANEKHNLWMLAMSVGLLVLIPYHWIIRIQNHTHIAYMVCFSFAVLKAQLTKTGFQVQGLVFLSSLGFMLGAFLRWEVGLIVMLILTAYIIAQGGIWELRKHLVQYIMFGAFIGYIAIEYFTDDSFYRQIEPNGEYAVLYAKSVKAPEWASEDLQLRYDLLNNWMVDDTSYVNSEFFRSAVTGGRVLIPVENLVLKDKMCSGFTKIVSSTQHYGLLILLLIFMLYGFKFRNVIFVIAVFGIITILNFANLMNDRHLINIVSGTLLLIATGQLPHFMHRNKRILLILLSLVSIVQLNQAHALTNVQGQRVAAKRQFAENILDMLENSPLYTDGQYDVLASDMVFDELHVLDKSIFLSFQQYSYSTFFDDYLRNHIGVGFGSYRSIYEAVCRKEGQALLLISNARLELLKKVLRNEGCFIEFEMVVPCNLSCFDAEDPFSGVSLQKLTMANPINEKQNLVR